MTEHHMDENAGAGPARGRVLVGLIIIAVGLILLADRIGMSGVHLSGRYWPLFLIAFGLVRLIDRSDRRDGRPRSRRHGAWFVFLGVWFLVNEFHLYRFDYQNSWPLLIVGAGGLMVWRALEDPGSRGRDVRES